MANLARVKNVGAKPLRVAYDSQTTVIHPGFEAILERECAIAHFGNWEARDVDMQHRFRWEEYQRIRGYGGTSDEGRTALEDDAVWEAVMPRVEIYELDGTRVTTVIEDPSGETMSEPVSRDKDRQLEYLTKQIDLLMAERAAEKADVAAPPADTTDDMPGTAPRRRGRPPGIETPAMSEAAANVHA